MEEHSSGHTPQAALATTGPYLLGWAVGSSGEVSSLALCSGP